jgi:2-oxo-4-hydroxy-4-carboxy--5-ureidoimidazoline (OHCU) decarboxylase
VNPQKFLDNPNMATKEDYTKAFIKVFEDSSIEAEVLK